MSSKPQPEYFGRDLEAMNFAYNYHSWIINEIKRYFGAEIAEVGAGNGSFSELIIGSTKSSLTAYEPSSNMFPLLKSRLNKYSQVRVVNDFFRADKAQFSSLLYINVLEHIEQDKEELKTAFTALGPGGYLIVFVPALKALFSDFDRQIGHFRRYSLAEIEAKALGAGFVITNSRYFDFIGVLPWFINFVVLKRKMSPLSVKLYDKFVVPFAKVAENLIQPPIGKNILLIAQKPYF